MTTRALLLACGLSLAAIGCTAVHSDCDAANCATPDTDAGVDAGAIDAGGIDAGRDAGQDGGYDAGPREDGGDVDAGPYDGGDITNPCTLSGSWVHDSSGMPGGGGDPADDPTPPAGPHDTYPGTWLTIPEGFCVHHFANVPDARQIRFAPGGELFVASPNTPTTGGTAGLSAIVVLPDDDQDGVADDVLHYRDGLPSTQGMMFANGYFYYQDTPAPTAQTPRPPSGTRIVRQPYTPGQRQFGSTEPELVINITQYSSALHWPKTLDISDNGEIFVSNGGDQGEICIDPMPFHGGIWKVDGTAGGAPIVKGLRNPIDVKCHRDGHNRCFATELARDYSASISGREKLVPISEGDNWGFPCCATTDKAFPDVCIPCGSSGAASYANSSSNCRSQHPDGGNLCSPLCSDVTVDTNSFFIGDTPFGFDFIDAQFSAPWDHQIIVALHGAFASWFGARVVSIDFNPDNGLPYASTDIDAGRNEGHMRDFLTGWDNGQHNHGRPADIAIAPDGRLFVANDDNGEIFWVAPIQPEVTASSAP